MVQGATHTVIETCIAFNRLEWAELCLTCDCAGHLIHVSSSGATSDYGTVVFVVSRISEGKCVEITWLWSVPWLRVIIVDISLSNIMLCSTFALSILSSKFCSALLLTLVIFGTNHHGRVSIEVTIWLCIGWSTHHNVFIDLCVQELAVRKLIRKWILTNHILWWICKVELSKSFCF